MILFTSPPLICEAGKVESKMCLGIFTLHLLFFQFFFWQKNLAKNLILGEVAFFKYQIYISHVWIRDSLTWWVDVSLWTNIQVRSFKGKENGLKNVYPLTIGGHKFVYSFHRFRFETILQNDRYKRPASVIWLNWRNGNDKSFSNMRNDVTVPFSKLRDKKTM
jgi:hypothetical protein